MRSKSSQVVISFCLNQSAGLPAMKRAELYRGLADFCGDEQEQAEFRKLATELELTEAKFRELSFKLNQEVAR